MISSTAGCEHSHHPVEPCLEALSNYAGERQQKTCGAALRLRIIFQDELSRGRPSARSLQQLVSNAFTALEELYNDKEGQLQKLDKDKEAKLQKLEQDKEGSWRYLTVGFRIHALS